MTPLMTRAAVAATAFLAAGPVAAATTTTITLGDRDCFGTNDATCATVPVPAFGASDDRSGPGDPAGTDIFGPLGPVSFSAALDIDAMFEIVSATLGLRVVGLDQPDFITSGFPGADGRGATFEVNGVEVGAFDPKPLAEGGNQSGTDPDGTPAPTDVFALSYDVPVGAIIRAGENVITVRPEDVFDQYGVPEDFAVDFVELTVVTRVAPPPPSVVPLPAPALLLAGGLAGLGALRRFGRSA